MIRSGLLSIAGVCASCEDVGDGWDGNGRDSSNRGRNRSGNNLASGDGGSCSDENLSNDENDDNVTVMSLVEIVL